MAFLAGPPDRGHGSVLQCKQPPPTLVPPSMTDISYTSLALGLQPAPSLPTHSDTANGKGTATEDLLQVLTVCTASSERHQTLVIGHMKSVEVGSVVSESRLHQAMALSTAGGDAAAHVFSAANTSATLLANLHMLGSWAQQSLQASTSVNPLVNNICCVDAGRTKSGCSAVL